jgi:hypothetical protein
MMDKDEVDWYLSSPEKDSRTSSCWGEEGLSFGRPETKLEQVFEGRSLRQVSADV